jgi:hypothetical protein
MAATVMEVVMSYVSAVNSIPTVAEAVAAVAR